MAIETRTIVFDEDELVQAAYAYCVRQDIDLPKGRLVAVTAGPEAEDRVRLGFDGAGNRLSEVILTYNQMAAGLIMYCAAAGIPLPRYARKRLTPAGEGMALIIRLPEYAGDAIVADEASAENWLTA